MLHVLWDDKQLQTSGSSERKKSLARRYIIVLSSRVVRHYLLFDTQVKTQLVTVFIIPIGIVLVVKDFITEIKVQMHVCLRHPRRCIEHVLETLEVWVTQIYPVLQACITDERIARLEELGLEWTGKGHTAWQSRLGELKVRRSQGIHTHTQPTHPM